MIGFTLFEEKARQEETVVNHVTTIYRLLLT